MRSKKSIMSKIDTNQTSSPSWKDLSSIWIKFIAYVASPIILFSSLGTVFDVQYFWFGHPNYSNEAAIKVISVAFVISLFSISCFIGVYKKTKWGYYLILLASSLFALMPMALVLFDSLHARDRNDLIGFVLGSIIGGIFILGNYFLIKQSKMYFGFTK